MARDLSRGEGQEEGNLLIEAVSLLVQRQRETENWVAEQIWQAEERAALADRRAADLEDRLAAIEEHLARLVHEIEPTPAESATAERLNRLRQQVADLRSSGDGTREAAPSPAAPQTVSAAARDVEIGAAPPRTFVAPRATATPARADRPRDVGVLELLGSSTDERWSVVLMGAGAVAVLYAALTLLRIG